MESTKVCQAQATDSRRFEESELGYLLPVYYKRIFPTNLLYRWLSYGGQDDKYFMNREFSFTLADDVYLRYQSFSNQKALEQALETKCPVKIDIGAVYNCKPTENKIATKFQALEKELVFDIDMTDYDDVRTCCSGAEVCSACWPFMTIAIKIIDRVLREDFGFQHLLWVFSGRRGIHCWVCDKRARVTSSTVRTAIADYMSVLQGGEFKNKKVFLGSMIHPSINKACDIIKDHFYDLILSKQKLLESEEQYYSSLSLLNNEDLKNDMEESSKELITSEDRWEELVKCHKETLMKGKFPNKDSYLIEEIMLQLCYPRLDIEVTKGVNHLLKAPFCVHPKTGKVCVPIDVQNLHTFDPFMVPTLNQLFQEIDAYAPSGKVCGNDSSLDQENEDQNVNRPVNDSQKTSLSTSICFFERFIQKLENSFKTQDASLLEF